MALRYAMVARGSVVLAEYSSTPSNAQVVARQILDKLPEVEESRISYSQDHFIFHVAKRDGHTFLCLAKDTLGHRIPFAFLADIHARFMRAYGWTLHTALAYSMNDEFSRVLSHQMDYYSHDPNADTINRIKDEIKQVQNIMIENIDRVLERGDKLELFVDKTAASQSQGSHLRKQARQFRKSMCWRNFKLVSLLIFLLLIVLYIVLVVVCNGLTLPTCG